MGSVWLGVRQWEIPNNKSESCRQASERLNSQSPFSLCPYAWFPSQCPC